MKQRVTRRLYFWLFIGLFCASAPLTVLYTAGYRWSAQGGVVKTGTIFVASTPRNALIHVDGKLFSDKTPTVVKTLKPSTYKVRLSLEEHIDWEKSLDVLEGETTFIENVLLFLDEDPTLYLGENVQDAAWSPNRERVAWADHQLGWTEIWASPIDAPSAKLISRVERVQNPFISWADNDTIHLSTTTQETWIQPDGTIVPEPETDEHHNYLEADQGITNVFNHESELIATLPLSGWEIRDERGPYILLKNTEQHRIALLTTQDEETPLLLLEDAYHAEWLRQDVLLFSDPFSISIYEPSKHQATLITRIGERIHNVQWHPEGGYLFYATDTQVRAIELDDRDGRRSTTLGTFTSIDSMTLGAQGRQLYIVAQKDFDEGIFRRTLYRRGGICLPGTDCTN